MRITRTYSHGQILSLEIGTPCDVRVRSMHGTGDRYRVVIDAIAVDDSGESDNTD